MGKVHILTSRSQEGNNLVIHQAFNKHKDAIKESKKRNKYQKQEYQGNQIFEVISLELID